MGRKEVLMVISVSEDTGSGERRKEKERERGKRPERGFSAVLFYRPQ
jgi:hypothetical protein